MKRKARVAKVARRLSQNDVVVAKSGNARGGDAGKGGGDVKSRGAAKGDEAKKLGGREAGDSSVNDFWKVCGALSNEVRLDLLRYLLMESGKTKDGQPCVIEIADHFHRLRTIGLSVVSQYLKKLREAGLVCCQRTDKRIYYRAFAATDDGRILNAAFRAFFESRPSRDRISSLVAYLHALSHERRNAIVRHLAAHPHDSIENIARATAMPKTTALRLFSQLAHARLISVEHTILQPVSEPEATLLALTLK